jgi:hypothetical protein
MVREGGLEPPHPKAPDPKSGASANSATPARGLYSVRNWRKLHNRVWQLGYRETG